MAESDVTKETEINPVEEPVQEASAAPVEEPVQEEDEGPKLTTFSTVTGFREAVSFIGFSSESEDNRLHLETFVNDDDGMVYMKMTTEKGVTALVDTTLKSECLEHDVYVNLQDFYIACDKGVQEGLVSLWIANDRLYIGSSYNEQLQCFEVEASMPFVEPFELDETFCTDETIQVEQMVIASILESCYEFERVELVRIGGTLSFRTGNERVCIATLPSLVKMLGTENEADRKDFAISIPVNVFRIMPLVNTEPLCTFDIDWSRGRVRSAGKLYAVNYKYSEGTLRSESSEGMTSYMKFDTIGMMATINMIYGLNYKDPIAPVELVPLDEKTVEIHYKHENRYSGTITMSGVLMKDTSKRIMFPMDVSTMMVRNAGQAVLEMLYGEDGRLFLMFRDKKFSRKCMYFGG